MGMSYERTKDINVLQISCRDSDRHLPPQRSAIEAMKKSLATVGQITPISVCPITRNTYRVITGATRFRAAAELRWKTIRASIWSGSALEYELHELVENVDRRELTGKQRREMKMKIKQLQAEKLASVEPSKGGRGNKGGMSEEARQMGISERTARRRNKPRHIQESAEVSIDAADTNPPSAAPSAPARARRTERPLMHKVSSNVTDDDFVWFENWCAKGCINIAEGMRRLISQERAVDERKEKAVALRIV